jgi:DNA mismatch repair ATPase MutS
LARSLGEAASVQEHFCARWLPLLVICKRSSSAVYSDIAAVIAFSELMAMDSGHHKWGLSLYDTGRYMRLDAAAQRALNVMKQRTDANDTFSLYGLMNKGRTPMAKRLLKVPHIP